MRTTNFVIFTCGLQLLAGCGTGGSQSVNVFAVHDNQTLDCNKAEQIAARPDDRSSLYQVAKAKLSYCKITGGGGTFLPVGYFDGANKRYEFRRLELDDPQAVRRLCLDLALEAGLDNVPPAELSFATEWGDFECASLAYELSQLGVSVLVAPAHLPLSIDIDPVLVLASGANPRREGVPKNYYDEVRTTLIKIISEDDANN